MIADAARDGMARGGRTGDAHPPGIIPRAALAPPILRPAPPPMTPVLLFWLAALALIALTLTALAWPLVRSGKHAKRTAPAQLAAAQAVYQDQKRQLDADLAAGAITAAEHAVALEELVQRFGAEIAEHPGAEPLPARAPSVVVVMLIAAIPVAAIVAYQILGNPAALDARSAENARPQFSAADVRAMVDNLAQKMQANPTDPKGWMLLARSYVALGRYDDAAAAFAQAAQRMPDDAQLYADWADALAMAQDRRLSGKPEALLARALQIDPRNPKALALSATALLERGDVDAALARWRELREIVKSGGDDAREIDAVIAEVEGNKHELSRGGTGAGTVTAPSQAPPPASTGQKTLTGRVEVDPKLAARVAPDDTVFIVARAAEGPRVPLAVTRLRARDLPASFRLDDSMGMVPEMKLSAAPRVVVEARVSKSGNAMTQPGDLRGTSAPLAPGTGDIRIVVGEIVP